MNPAQGSGRGGQALPDQFGDPLGSSERNKMLAVALVVLLVIGFGLFKGVSALVRGGPLLWSLDGRTIGGGGSLRPTTWATGPTVAITRARDVTGYDAATGDPRWTVPLSGTVCAASARPAGDRVAVQFGQGRPGCDRVAVIDLKAGAKVWERTIDAERSGGGQVVIGEGVVVVDRLYGTSAFRLEDGRPLWNADGDGKDCAFKGLAGGPVLVAGQSCDADGGRVRRVHRLDPGSGRLLWSYEAPPGYQVEAMPSSRPAVLGLRHGDRLSERPWRFVVLNDSGAQVASLDAGRFSVDCSVVVRDPTRCTDVVVTGDSLYLRRDTRPATKEFRAAPVVAFDLATGRIRWSTRNPDGNHLFPIAMDGDRLIAGQPRTAGKNGERPRLVAIDPATGATTVMWDLTGHADFWLRTVSDRQYAGGRFFLTKALVTGRDEVAFRAYGPR
ncbi:PQQ-binding-like beta-propeller repeat protein [Spirillospora sp. CA-255316]